MNLLGAVHREDLATLARNPLLLTLMATLHSNRTRLPDDRADLYNEVVELLLQRWNETIGADRGLLDALRIPSLKLGHLREQIEHLAFEAHAANVGKEGTADIAEGDLLKAFCPLLGGSHDKAALVVAYVEKRAGLLLGQGPRERQRQFTFPHRTFQEYLAACYLARQPDFRTRAVDLARANPTHWREVLTLAARNASADAGVPVADALVHCERFEVWSRSRTPEESDWCRAMLAAEQLLEIGLASVASREERRAVRDRVAGWLVALLAKEGLPARDLAHAGNLLARLGDPRPGVGLRPDGLPDIVFEELQFPAGEFALAENRRKVQIEQPYRLSRYPVTVAQFQAFVDAKGYEQDDLWPPEGPAWRDGKAELNDLPEWYRNEYRKLDFPIRGPQDYGPVFQTPNHPRVGVSWYEATAFCRWLTKQLHSTFDIQHSALVCLPHEGEWEQAAGWNVKEKKVGGRYFPWGGSKHAPDLAQRCNMAKTGIGHTSAVGLFPSGAADCGALDMSGNVWEWCENLYQKDKPWRVLRGGSWLYVYPRLLSCSCRFRDHPGLRSSRIGFRCVMVGMSSARG